MQGVNKVFLIGNLGRDPEMRGTNGGSRVAAFSIATSEGWNNKDTGKRDTRTEWHNIVCFSHQAKFAEAYLKKGAQVWIEGSLRTSSWEQDGVKRYKTEVMARTIEMLGKKDNTDDEDQYPF